MASRFATATASVSRRHWWPAVFLPVSKRDAPEVTRFVRVLERCQSLRRLGSCALNMCYVADGRLDAYWATNVSAWDSAAGTVIAREAGSVLTAYDGSALGRMEPTFCVSATPHFTRPWCRCCRFTRTAFGGRYCRR